MKIQDILKFYRDHPDIKSLAEKLNQSEKGRFQVKGMVGSQVSMLLSSLFQNTDRSSLIVLNDKEEALYFQNDLKVLMPQKEVLLFPASYKRPYQIEEISNANVLQRAEVLNQLNQTRSSRVLIVTFAEALSEQVINKRSLVRNTLDVKKGDDVGMEFIEDVLEEYGFESVDFVVEPGTYSVRGGIIDVFSFAHDLPYRIEFFGEDVDSIRSFDPVDQMSKEEYKSVSLIPNIQTNLLDVEKVHFLDYLSEKTLVYLQGLDFVKADLDRHYSRAERHYADLVEKSGGAATSLPPEEMYTQGSDLLQGLEKLNTLEFGKRFYFRKIDHSLEWKGSPQPAFKKEFQLLSDHLKGNNEAGILNFVLSDNPKQLLRLTEILAEINSEASFNPIESVLHQGFLDKKLKLCCYTDHEIFERYHKYKNRVNVSRSQAITLKELKELQAGDYVTHIQHGIGKYEGLRKIRMGEHVQEALKIVFFGGDEVYVNVNNFHKIAKYTGKDATPPKLSKLGSPEWAKKKAKTKKKIKELAFNLIGLYAKRKATEGFAFQEDSYMEQELEASFMYEDTPDQEKCNAAVKRDMEMPNPMDRLVCGDVGFGKTEIAVRAAFKAAVNGKQTAILVPTTILALQHYHTFADRLHDFGVTVDYLNRFKTAKQVKETLAKLAEGKVDILIGTHRIVSKDVKFKDLGLMIIDEEQKFGVGVKDKLKTLKLNIDSLTLTATPIPRTLQFSLLGVRDLSIIETPPPNRQPVETIVQGYSQEGIRDAISYELKRGGQCFFVHNRVADLNEMAANIQLMVPDARIAIAHGQLPPAKIEKVMRGFIENAYDVLVATTIIESGLDIPNANTIIINQAQNYGLSDLHQMRGRVGRSNRKAFCYLFAPDESMLSSDARKRLKAIEEFTDLGSGFHIALKDLDIRGAGDLLGGEQSGFINEIGYDMYQKIMAQAVQELKEEEFPELFEEELKNRESDFVEDTQVETDQNILIPERYLPSVSERLNFYNKIAGARTEEEMRLISRELIDRFGPIPKEVLGLFDAVRIRKIGKSLGFEKVVQKKDVLRLYFPADKTSKYYSSPYFAILLSWVQFNAKRAKFKESPKYLSIVVTGVTGIKAIYLLLKELDIYVEEMVPKG